MRSDKPGHLNANILEPEGQWLAASAPDHGVSTGRRDGDDPAPAGGRCLSYWPRVSAAHCLGRGGPPAGNSGRRPAAEHPARHDRHAARRRARLPTAAGAATPNLDALAGGGVRFTFAHAHAVVTLPSHASILTGTYPFQHGVPREQRLPAAAPAMPTLATLLKARGLRDRRVRRRLSARRAIRADAGVRRLRRPVRRASRGARLQRCPSGRRTRSSRRRTQWIDAQAGGSGSPGCTSSIRTRPIGRRRRSIAQYADDRISAKSLRSTRARSAARRPCAAARGRRSWS